MSDGENVDRAAIDGIEDGIRETPEWPASGILVERAPRHRESLDECEDASQLIEKRVA